MPEKIPQNTLPPGQAIPLLPEQIPQQKLRLVKSLPVRPLGFGLIHAPWRKSIKTDSRESHTLCQLEWAWSPMHNRIQTWELTQSRCKRYYLLQTGFFNDESLFQHYDEDDQPVDGPEPWEFQALGHCKVHPELSLHEHAVLLLHDALVAETTDSSLDKYHWINAEELLDCADLEAIARSVWPQEQP